MADAGVRGLFVTATDTGVGKTVVAAAIVAALRARGERVAAFKPVVTGTDEPADPDWPPDDELLAAAAGMRAQDVTPARFGPQGHAADGDDDDAKPDDTGTALQQKVLQHRVMREALVELSFGNRRQPGDDLPNIPHEVVAGA